MSGEGRVAMRKQRGDVVLSWDKVKCEGHPSVAMEVCSLEGRTNSWYRYRNTKKEIGQ